MSGMTRMEYAGIPRRFYLWLAGICVLLPLAGFAPTYWLQLPAGTVVGTPGLHLHALVFALWPLFFFTQAWLGATGRIARHRAVGLAGIALATAVVFTGMNAAIRELGNNVAAGHPNAVPFALAPVMSMLVFGGLVTASIATVARPETHKRLMLLATISIMPPAVARFLFMAVAGVGPGLRPGLMPPPPLFAPVAASLLADLLVVIAVAYDWRRRGRPHRAYLIGGGIMLAAQLLVIPLSATGLWHAIAMALAVQ